MRLFVTVFASFITSIVFGGVPAFVSDNIYTEAKTEVREIVESETADLIVLKHGFDRNLREGMKMIVFGEQGTGAEIILAHVTEKSSVGLILNVNGVIRTGDKAQVKTLIR
jgi:hypothetical protein